MAKKKDIQQCEYYEICDARLHPHSSTDKPNMAAHLGLWCLFSLVGILGVLQLDMSAMTISTSKEFISFSFHNVGISFICNALLSVVFITIVDWLQGDSKLCS